jgi:hypothetical protein
MATGSHFFLSVHCRSSATVSFYELRGKGKSRKLADGLKNDANKQKLSIR